MGYVFIPHNITELNTHLKTAIGYGVSLSLFVLALRHIGTARTGAYFSLAPFMGAIVSILVLGDKVITNLIAAAALMGLGV